MCTRQSPLHSSAERFHCLTAASSRLFASSRAAHPLHPTSSRAASAEARSSRAHARARQRVGNPGVATSQRPPLKRTRASFSKVLQAS
eukprot:9972147-Alexandrium_andersonii.AAC.1